MPIIRRADAEEFARDAVVLNLHDLERQGADLTRQAQAEAERIVAAAEAERDRLLQNAHEEGFKAGREAGFTEGRNAGLEEGRAQAMQELAPALRAISERWSETLEAVIAQRDQMLVEARTDIVRLAALIAQRVTKRVTELDPGVVEAQMREALALLSSRTTPRVAVHPEDEPLARQALPDLLARFEQAEHIELLTDPRLDRGSCVLRTPTGGRIDATISAQLDRIVADLLPDDGNPAPPASIRDQAPAPADDPDARPDEREAA
ncbi:MAG: FliH/SctL family protein [Phycisphaerales bacterium JB059]